MCDVGQCRSEAHMQQRVQDPIAVEGLHFVIYLTQDFRRARTFYESLFGLRPGAYDTEYFVEYELPDGNAFSLGHLPDTPFAPSAGAVFGVPDAEAAIVQVEALGGKLITRYGGAACTSGWCTDTEGNSFGVHQRK
jgi:predicted enzyme related to lactoylglutathione lyase